MLIREKSCRKTKMRKGVSFFRLLPFKLHNLQLSCRYKVTYSFPSQQEICPTLIVFVCHAASSSLRGLRQLCARCNMIVYKVMSVERRWSRLQCQQQLTILGVAGFYSSPAYQLSHTRHHQYYLLYLCLFC